MQSRGAVGPRCSRWRWTTLADMKPATARSACASPNCASALAFIAIGISRFRKKPSTGRLSPQLCLCPSSFQPLFWHSRPQYDTTLHLVPKLQRGPSGSRDPHRVAHILFRRTKWTSPGQRCPVPEGITNRELPSSGRGICARPSGRDGFVRRSQCVGVVHTRRRGHQQLSSSRTDKSNGPRRHPPRAPLNPLASPARSRPAAAAADVATGAGFAVRSRRRAPHTTPARRARRARRRRRATLA